MDTAVANTTLIRGMDEIIKAIVDEKTAEHTQRLLIRAASNYESQGGKSIKPILAKLKQHLSNYRQAVEDKQLTPRQTIRARATLLAVAGDIKSNAEKNLHAIKASLAKKASDEQVIKNLQVVASGHIKKPLQSLKQLEDEIKNSGGNILGLQTKLSTLAGPVGLNWQHLPKTPESSKALQRANPETTPQDDGYMDAVTMRGRMDSINNRSQNESFIALKNVQEEIEKLPKTLKKGEATRLVKGPIWVTTSPIINETSLQRLKIKGVQLFPGWILKEQLLLAFNPSADLGDIMVPKGDGKKGQRKITIEDRILQVVEALNASTDKELMDVTDGQGIVLPGSKLRFLWLLPVKAYMELNKFTIDSIGFPKTKDLVDPESRSRLEHEQTLKAEQSSKEKDSKYEKAAAKRKLFEGVTKPMLKEIEKIKDFESKIRNVEIQQDEIFKTLKLKSIELNAIAETVENYEAMKRSNRDRSKIKHIEDGLAVAQKAYDAKRKEFEEEKTKLVGPLRERKKQLLQQIEGVRLQVLKNKNIKV